MAWNVGKFEQAWSPDQVTWVEARDFPVFAWPEPQASASLSNPSLMQVALGSDLRGLSGR